MLHSACLSIELQHASPLKGCEGHLRVNPALAPTSAEIGCHGIGDLHHSMLQEVKFWRASGIDGAGRGSEEPVYDGLVLCMGRGGRDLRPGELHPVRVQYAIATGEAARHEREACHACTSPATRTCLRTIIGREVERGVEKIYLAEAQLLTEARVGGGRTQSEICWANAAHSNVSACTINSSFAQQYLGGCGDADEGEHAHRVSRPVPRHCPAKPGSYLSLQTLKITDMSQACDIVESV